MRLTLFKLLVVWLMLCIPYSGSVMAQGCLDSLIITHAACSPSAGTGNARVRAVHRNPAATASTNFAWSLGTTIYAVGYGVDTLTATPLGSGGTNLYGQVPPGLYSIAMSIPSGPNACYTSAYFDVLSPTTPLDLPGFIINQYPSGCAVDGRVTIVNRTNPSVLGGQGGYGRYRYRVIGTGQRVDPTTGIVVPTGGISRDSFYYASPVFDSLPARNLQFCVVDSGFSTVITYTANNTRIGEFPFLTPIPTGVTYENAATGWRPGCEQCTNVSLIDPLTQNLVARFPFIRTKYRYVRSAPYTGAGVPVSAVSGPEFGTVPTSTTPASLTAAQYRYNFNVQAHGNSIYDFNFNGEFGPPLDSLINCFDSARANVTLPVKPRPQNADWNGITKRGLSGIFDPYTYTLIGIRDSAYVGSTILSYADTIKKTKVVATDNEQDHVTWDRLHAGKYVSIVTDRRGCADTSDTFRISQRPRISTAFVVAPTNDSLTGPGYQPNPGDPILPIGSATPTGSLTDFDPADINGPAYIQPGPGPNPNCTYRLLLSMDGEAWFPPNNANQTWTIEFVKWPDMATTAAPNWRFNPSGAGRASGTMQLANVISAPIIGTYPAAIYQNTYYNVAEDLRPGEYVVRITDNSVNCSILDTVRVFSNIPLAVTKTVDDSVICWRTCASVTPSLPNCNAVDQPNPGVYPGIYPVVNYPADTNGWQAVGGAPGGTVRRRVGTLARTYPFGASFNDTYVPDSAASIKLNITGGLKFSGGTAARRQVPYMPVGFQYEGEYNVTWFHGLPDYTSNDPLKGFRPWGPLCNRVYDSEGESTADVAKNVISVFRDSLPRIDIPAATNARALNATTRGIGPTANTAWIYDPLGRIIGANYTAVIIDSAGCIKFDSVRVYGSQNPYRPFAVVGVDAFGTSPKPIREYFFTSCGSNITSPSEGASVVLDTVELNASYGAFGPFTYSWHQITGTSAGTFTFGPALSTSSRVDGLQGGSQYVVFVNDKYGCSNHDTFRVYQQTARLNTTGITGVQAVSCLPPNPGGRFDGLVPSGGAAGLYGAANGSYRVLIYVGNELVWVSAVLTGTGPFNNLGTTATGATDLPGIAVNGFVIGSSLASYTSLPPGSYTIELIDNFDGFNGNDQNGFLNGPPQSGSLGFVQAPPPGYPNGINGDAGSTPGAQWRSERRCVFRNVGQTIGGIGPTITNPAGAALVNPTCASFPDGRVTVSGSVGRPVAADTRVRFFIALASNPSSPIFTSPLLAVDAGGNATYTFLGLQAGEYVAIIEDVIGTAAVGDGDVAPPATGCRRTSAVFRLVDPAPIRFDITKQFLCPEIGLFTGAPTSLSAPTAQYKVTNLTGGVPFATDPRYRFVWHRLDDVTLDTLFRLPSTVDSAFIPDIRHWYQVTVFDATTPVACSVSVRIEPQTSPIRPLLLKVEYADVRCRGGRDGIIRYFVMDPDGALPDQPGGTPPYLYILQDQATGDTVRVASSFNPFYEFAALDTGKYSVGLRDANNCLVTAAVQLRQPTDSLRILPVLPLGQGGNRSFPTYSALSNITLADTVKPFRPVSGWASGMIIGVSGGNLPEAGLAVGGYVADSIKVIDSTINRMIIPDSATFSVTGRFRPLVYGTGIPTIGSNDLVVNPSVGGNIRWYRVPLSDGCDYRGFIGRRNYIIIIKDRKGCTDTLRYSPDVDSISITIDTVRRQRCSGPLAGTPDAQLRATVTGGNGKYLFVWSDQPDINVSPRTSPAFPGLNYGSPAGTVVNTNLPPGILLKAIPPTPALAYKNIPIDTVSYGRTASGWAWVRVYDSTGIDLTPGAVFPPNGPYLPLGVTNNCPDSSYSIRVKGAPLPLAPPFQAWLADSTDKSRMCHDAFTGRVAVNIVGGTLNPSGSYRIRYLGPGIPLPYREFQYAPPAGSTGPIYTFLPPPTNTDGLQLGTGWTLVDVLDDSGCSAFITPQYVTLLNPPPVRINRDSTRASIRDMQCCDLRNGRITVKLANGGTPDGNSMPYRLWFRVDTITTPVRTQDAPTSDFSMSNVFGDNLNSCPGCPGYLGTFPDNPINIARYYVTVRDSNGCIDTMEFVIRRPDCLKLVFENRTIACNPNDRTGSVTIKAFGGTPFPITTGTTVGQGYFILWNFETGGNGGNYSRDTIEGSRGRTISNQLGQRYSVAVVDAAGCVAHNFIDLGFLNPPVISDTTVNVQCGIPNSGAIRLEVQTSAPYRVTSYNWVATQGGIVPPSQAGNKDLINIPPGLYTVTVNAVDTSYGNTIGCPTTRSIRVEQETQGRVEIKASRSLNFCLGDSVVLTADRPGDWTSFLWSSTAQPIQTTPSLTVRQTSTVFLKVRSSVTGCEAYDTVDIRVSPSTRPVITQVGNVLISSEGSSYVWRLGGNIIQGATGQVYTPLVTGSYTVTISNISDGCTAESEPYLFISSVEDKLIAEQIKIYPNPTSTTFEVQFPVVRNYGVKAELYDAIGKLVGTEVLKSDGQVMRAEFNVSGLAKGVYTLKVQDGTAIYSHRVLVK